MLFRIYKNELANLRFENKLLLVFSILVLLSNALVVYSSRNRVVFFYPVGVCTGTKTSTEAPDRQYLAAMASFVVDTYLTYTPANVKQKFSALLPLIEESYYPEFKDKLLRQIEKVEEQDITSVFRTDSMAFDRKDRVIKISGVRYVYVSSGLARQAYETWYIFYDYRYGTFRIKKIASKLSNLNPEAK